MFILKNGGEVINAQKQNNVKLIPIFVERAFRIDKIRKVFFEWMDSKWIIYGFIPITFKIFWD